MSRELTYLDAISEGLRDEMRRDPSVFLMGEDIGAYGGAFKVTKGFLEEFGAKRVIDTVLAEGAIVGAAAGAALAGLRPVAEMQFADFVTNGFNQVVNIAAKYHYRNFVSVPMVLRLPSGGGISGGPFHSLSPEGWFFHTPGLKIVAPAMPYDAKGLMIAAIRDPNPVVFLEHKFLYRHAKGEVPEGDYAVPIGRAEVRRSGADVAVITYGAGVHWALEAAGTVSSDGIETEVLDLRSLMPFDRVAVLEAVKKCGKALVVHEDTLTGGIGAEISAIIASEAFEFLDAPVRRVAALDVPVPFAPTLERAALPDALRVAAAIRSLAAY